MEYKEKYKEMAEQFRKDGIDEYLVEKFIREEMDRDEFLKNEGSTELEAYKEWISWSEERRQFYLGNAFCGQCGGRTSFASRYSIRQNKWNLVVEGTCSKCGGKIRRLCD